MTSFKFKLSASILTVFGNKVIFWDPGVRCQPVNFDRDTIQLITVEMKRWNYQNSLGKNNVVHIYYINASSKTVSSFALKRDLTLKPQTEFYHAYL